MNTFGYSAEKINEIIKNNDLKKVCMKGVDKDLRKLKPVIEKIYDEYIFYLDYWSTECMYFGWDWDEDNGEMRNQKKITAGITKKFHEIYALILAGLGEKCEKF